MQPYFPLNYRIHWRRPPGPWQDRNLPGGIVHLSEAIRSAQAFIQEQPGRIARVVDQHGKVHWESDPEVPEDVPAGGVVLRDYVAERFKQFNLQTGKTPQTVLLSSRVYAALLPQWVTGNPAPPPTQLMGAAILVHNDATRPELELA